MIRVKIDGQDFRVPDPIGANDDLLRTALAPFVPWIVNAHLQRKEEQGNTLVTVVKRADTKGNAAAVLAVLREAPEEVNPAVALWKRLEGEVRLDQPGAIVEWQPAIDQAIQEGERDSAAVEAAVTRLRECAVAPATRISLGF